MVRNQILSPRPAGMVRFLKKVEGQMRRLDRSQIREMLHRLLAWIGRTRRKEPEPPAADPFAYVTAPKKPRPSNRSAAALAELPEE